MTYTELAKKVAAEHGQTIDDQHADHVLWEYTPFPMVMGADEIEAALHDHFKVE